jgi:uncharacterized protein (TIGR03545 family)
MSIAGSSPSATAAAKPKRVAIFRWRGIAALAFMCVVGVVAWLIFGRIWVRDTIQDTASQSLGTQVDVAGIRLDVVDSRLELRDFAVADPRDLTRNLIDAAVVRVFLDGDALLQKKIVIRELSLDGVRTGTRRATPARPMQGGFAPRALQALEQWRKQFDVPLLSLTPVDTIKSLLLDPSQLATVKRANELRLRGDSLRSVLTTAVQSIPFRATIDSTQALVARLNGQTPRTLGLTGTRNAINDVRRLTARIDTIRRQLDAVYKTTRTGVDSLVASVRAIDEARRADYEFARGLLKLPTIDAPNIGPALFGRVSIDAFEHAMYWVSLGREYAPPGLLPRETPGPKRVRRSGTTVHFVKQAVYPRFLLRNASMTFALGDDAGMARGNYRLSVADVTSEPALVARPMRFALTRSATSSAIESFTATGTFDHSRSTAHEVFELRADGVRLPSFALPATPIRADFGRARSLLRLDVNGNTINGTWTLAAPNVAWAVDSARARTLNTMERLVTRVIQSIENVDINANIGGTLRAPRFSVRSNLDRAVADGVRSVVGDEVAKAQVKVRAQVDSLAERAAEPVRARVAELRAEVDQRAAEAQAMLDDAKRRLAAQLKTLGAGVLGLP